MLNFLKKPYPAREISKRNLIIALCTGVFVGLFLVLFRPFGLHSLRSPFQLFLIFGYGVITFFIAALFLCIIPYYFPKLQDERSWTVGKEIIYLNVMILLIAACNTLYTPVLSSFYSINLSAFLSMISNTFLVSIIPSTFLVLNAHNRLFLRHETESKSIHLSEVEEDTPNVSVVQLVAGTESFEINLEHLLYIESVGNYANIISQVDNESVTKLFRSTLKNLESQIQNANIIRCHRSYFVNLKKVIDVKGNAQGFKLSMENCDDIVPVSRKYVPIIKGYFAKSI